MEEINYSTLNTKSTDSEIYIPYIYSNPQIEVNNASNQVTVTVTLWFGSSGYAITSWDTLWKEGNNFYVNIETWFWNGAALCVIMSESYTYELGCLEEGDYSFTFQSWNQTVKSVNFSVINSLDQESLPYLFPPQKITSLEVFNVGSNRLNVSWALNPEPNIHHYNVYRSTVSNFTIAPSNLIASSTTYFYTDTGLTGGQVYYYRVTAVDDYGNEGPPSEEVANYPIDLGENFSPSLISPHPNVIAAHRSVEIRIRVNGAGGIEEVFLNYTVNRGIPQIIRMNLVECFLNGTLILTGQIPGQPAGVRVDYCIIVVDLYGCATTSLSCSYQVSTNEFAGAEGVSWWMVAIICIVIGAVAGSAYGSIKFFVNLTKEKKIKALLKKVVNAPSISNFENLEALTSHSEDPRVIIENPFEPVNFNLEYYQYQRFAGRIDGFEFVCLLGIFNSLLKAFPALNQYFEGINKLMYITEIKNLSLWEQLELFKDLINRNSDFDIQLEIDNLMIQLNTSEKKHKWEYVLPQLNYCYDLSQVLSDREYSTDFFLLSVIIMRW